MKFPPFSTLENEVRIAIKEKIFGDFREKQVLSF